MLSSSEQQDSTVTSTRLYIARIAVVAVDPPLLYPAPAGIKNQFLLYQTGPPLPPTADPLQFAEGFMLVGQWPTAPIYRITYTDTPLPWPNVPGGKLLAFDTPVPYP